MSLFINQKQIVTLSDLSLLAQKVIQILPGQDLSFSYLFEQLETPLSFETELDFVSNIWAGSRGSQVFYSQILQCWLTPVILFNLDIEELNTIIGSQNMKGGIPDSSLAALYRKYEWLNKIQFKEIEQFKTTFDLLQSPILGVTNAENLKDFYKLVVSQRSDDIGFSEALTFAEQQAVSLIEYANLVAFYLTAIQNVGLIELSGENRISAVSQLFATVSSLVEKKLLSPHSHHAPDLEKLKSIQSQWFSQHHSIGFDNVAVGCQIVAEIVELPFRYPAQVLANIEQAFTEIATYFKSVNVSAAYPTQTGDIWQYKFENEQYQATLLWQPSGALCLKAFAKTTTPQTLNTSGSNSAAGGKTKITTSSTPSINKLNM